MYISEINLQIDNINFSNKKFYSINFHAFSNQKPSFRFSYHILYTKKILFYIFVLFSDQSSSLRLCQNFGNTLYIDRYVTSSTFYQDYHASPAFRDTKTITKQLNIIAVFGIITITRNLHIIDVLHIKKVDTEPL